MLDESAKEDDDVLSENNGSLKGLKAPRAGHDSNRVYAGSVDGDVVIPRSPVLIFDGGTPQTPDIKDWNFSFAPKLKKKKHLKVKL